MQDSLNILLSEPPDVDFIEHHGVKGMHWGVRKARYKQNVKSIKQKYKTMNKKIMKERSKDIIKYLKTPSGVKQGMVSVEQIHSHRDKIAINEFKKQQELKIAKSKLYKDINNRKSEKYLRKAREQFVTTYQNRMVIKKPDGSFSIQRFYYG